MRRETTQRQNSPHSLHKLFPNFRHTNPNIFNCPVVLPKPKQRNLMNNTRKEKRALSIHTWSKRFHPIPFLPAVSIAYPFVLLWKIKSVLLYGAKKSINRKFLLYGIPPQARIFTRKRGRSLPRILIKEGKGGGFEDPGRTFFYSREFVMLVCAGERSLSKKANVKNRQT